MKAYNEHADRCGCELGGVGTAMLFHMVAGPRGGRPVVRLVDIDTNVGRWPRRAVRGREVRVWRPEDQPEVTVGDEVAQALEARGISPDQLCEVLERFPHRADLNKMARGASRG